MRLHITLDEELVRELDQGVGRGQRSQFIAQAVRAALDDTHRWGLIEAALGSIGDQGHGWDADPARWVHEGRRSCAGHVG